MPTALTDLGPAPYRGFSGGLFPGGKNSPPRAYQAIGKALGATVRPRDEKGRASSTGKIGLIAIGMSNTSREFLEFIRLMNAESRRNSHVVWIDAAQDGAAATEIALASGGYWQHVDQALRHSEISAAQAQVVWLKTALARESRGFPENARLLQRTLRSILGILTARFSQLKVIYVSSRTYGGYSQTNLSPEPIAFESGFAVKWLIEERIERQTARRPATPWVSWGPYLWADGLNPRSDGLIWERTDFEPDGVHTSAQGAARVARMLLQFFQQDAAAQSWFLTKA